MRVLSFLRALLMRNLKASKVKATGVMELDKFVPALMTFIANRLTNSGSALYRRAFGIGMMDFRIMAMLSIEPGASGARIAEVIDLDKAAVSRTLASLEKRKYVHVMPGAGRARKLSLTRAGEALYQKAWQLSQERERRLLSLLSSDEQRVLREILQRLLKSTALVAALSEPDSESRPQTVNVEVMR